MEAEKVILKNFNILAEMNRLTLSQKLSLSGVLLLILVVGSQIVVYMLFDAPKHLPGKQDEYYMEQFYQCEQRARRLENLGGKSYSSLVKEQANLLQQSFAQNYQITMPNIQRLDYVERQLKNIFWYGWWLRKNYIIMAFWTQCIFQVLDQQKMFPPNDFKAEFLQYFKTPEDLRKIATGRM